MAKHFTKFHSYAEVLVEPVSQNISYGELGHFFCSVRVEDYFGALYWLMNDQSVQFSTNIAVDGFRREDPTPQNNIETSTLSINGSFYKYNNLQVKCGVSNIKSSTVFLRIHGKMTAAYNINLLIIMFI